MKTIKRLITLLTLATIYCWNIKGNTGDTGNGLLIPLPDGKLQIIALNDHSVRVKFYKSEPIISEDYIYIKNTPVPKYSIKENDEETILELNGITAIFNKKEEIILFKNKKGEIILKEKAGGRFIANATVQNEPTYKVKQSFISPDYEYLYGTGQFQDGYLNIKGLTRRLTQVNSQISIPFVLSNKGYGLLWNNYGLTDFNPADNRVELRPAETGGEAVTVDATSTAGNRREVRRMNAFTGTFEIPKTGRYSFLLDVGQQMARKHYLSIDGKNIFNINNIWLPPTTSVIVELEAGKHSIEVQGERNDKPVLFWREVTGETTFQSPVAQALDYTVFAGSGDEAIAAYRKLTGAAPMMPLWATGYIHCRERYNTQQELLENAREFRRLQLPIDLIVQDWQYWGKYGWNAMRFDEDRYPDPAAMVKELHDMNLRLMISVWSKIDKQSEVGKQMEEKGYYIANTDWIDFFNPDAAAFYWQNFSNRLLKPYQIDAWWQDATEPENDDLQGRRIKNGTMPGEVYRNVYPLLVSKTIYEGLRRDDAGRRAMIFTRCGFPGMQRYAAATWSGDVGNDWETLRRQITGGLGQMAAGLPWWTYDAGGFFRPADQYTNTEYHERFLRWFQAATFFPLMRVHGYMSNTEPWRYGDDVKHTVNEYLDLRYRLLPYIYSQNAAVSFNGSTLMRPLVMDFANDMQALEQRYQFMFGPSLLVAPVVEGGVTKWNVYLPENKNGWIDFWSGQKYPGGKSIEIDTDISKIPLFVKAGSIIPMGPEKQYASEKNDKPWEIRIYPGADGSFTVYQDEGDNYNYEKGKFSTFELKWEDAAATLYLSDRKGSFLGMDKTIRFNVVIVKPQTGIGIYRSATGKSIQYSGKAIKIVM
jgi:alpha-D-xyloside xylohydrolase